MAFEHFKTQVLLLHSEQSTLDSLSTGFSDRYSVHCATSGTEALNTLGATPIDVIVSAQKLPGMSGLDALREAKKRSPETITILMAGDGADDGLEALVTEKEVFQIIRGEIEPQKLCELVDNATKTARLVALSDSANDTSADVDEPGEHIIMETADNGSFIVSDGTGQLPVLKPEKVGPASNAGGKQVDILVLTQDDEFLETVRESTRGTHKVHHAVKPGQAEDFVRNFPVGVIVTDAGLAGTNVEALAQRMRSHRERLVAIVAGRRDDGEMLMDLINRGQVYRFLLKPVSPGRARLAVEASVKHHLEAPEHAFQGRPASKSPKPPPAPKPRPQAQPSPAKPAAAAPKQAAKPAAAPGKPASGPVKQTATPQPAKAPAARPARPPAPPVTPPEKPAGGGLDDAFDETSSFTETMTGIAASVGKSISNAASGLKGSRGEADDKVEPKKPEPAPSPAPDPASLLDESLDGPDGSSGSALLNPKILGIAAAVIVAVSAGFLMLGGDDEPVTSAPVVDAQEPAADDAGTSVIEPQASTAEVVPAAMPDEFVGADSGAMSEAESDTAPETFTNDAAVLVASARQARADGDTYSPAGSNAVELYVAARDVAPDDPEIGAELELLIEEVFGQAETALLENRTQDASRALRVIGIAAPDSPRLNFLDSQLRQQQLQGALDEARLAIRESRFEDAGQQLARAETFAGGSTAEIDRLSQELSAARDTEQLDDVLATAGQRLEADRLIAPSNNNARYYFELAQSIDPDNAAAQQGLLAIANKLVLRARAAIDSGELDAAESLLEDARELDPRSDAVAAAADALRAARTPPPAPARAEPTPAPARTSTATASEPAANAAAAQASTGERPSTAAQTLTPEADSADETATAAPSMDLVSISALKRTKYVGPKYPRAAQRRNLGGYVDIVFTVMPGGSVADLSVREAEPGDIFVNSALEAVEQWEFEPVIENGVAVPKRVAVRLSFSLQ